MSYGLSYEMIATLMFASMLVMLLTGQRVFAAIGFVASGAALLLYGQGAVEMPFNAAFQLFNWFPMLTLPLFIYMGYVLSDSGIAEDLYRMFHVWFGRVRGGLAIGTILMMVIISAMNGLSVAGMAIGATIALPEMLRRGYDKVMITGVVQAGSTLGILVPPSVVLVLYGMIARQPVSQLWLAGVIPGLMMATMFIIYIVIRCRLQPHLAPTVSEKDLNMPMREKLKLLRAGIIPFLIFFFMTGLFVMGFTSLVESSAVGATSATLAAWWKGRLSWPKLQETARKTLAISCMFLWIILAALAFGAIFDGIGAGRALQGLFITRWELSPWEVLLLMQLSYLVMGMFLDDTAMLVIVAPLYVPLVRLLDLGIDNVLIWYGILYTITCQIAYMTPPFGYNLFLMRAMAPSEITLMDIYRSIIPFVAIMICAALIITVFPQVALWLPSYVSGR
jgi:tripartite ATP-independent transporter DctM subunit